MTNYQYYKEQLNIIFNNFVIGLSDKEVGLCEFIKKHILSNESHNCNVNCVKCAQMFNIWLNMEHHVSAKYEKECVLDPLFFKIKPNTLCRVKYLITDPWKYAYFAMIKDNIPHFYKDGQTSITVDRFNNNEPCLVRYPYVEICTSTEIEKIKKDLIK